MSGLDVEKAQRSIERSDKIIKVSVAGICLTTLIMLFIIVAQLIAVQEQIKTTLDETRSAGASNHQKTQAYIKCVASALLIPVAQRNESVFDKCGLSEGASGKPDAALNSSDATRVEPALPPETATSPSPSVQQPTTSSPPDPDPADAPEDRGLVLNLIDGVLAIPRSLLGNN